MKSRMKLLRIAAILACTLSPEIGQSAVLRANAVASDKQASIVANDILQQGGSAADAAIAAAMVLAVVSPQNSGPGGVAEALSWRATSHDLHAWDGSAIAPAAAGPDLFLGRDGKPMGLRDIIPGGRAVGVPGGLRMLEALHRAEGHLAWDRLIAPAITLAEDGYIVSPELAALLHTKSAVSDDVLALFRDSAGNLPNAGDTRRNPALAETLRMIAASGADAVLRGPVAADIATAVRNANNPGLLTADDLAAFAAPGRTPFCTPYRAIKICSLGPPDASGTALVRAFAVLDHEVFPRLDPAGAESARILLQVWRHTTADAAAQLADPDAMTIHPDDLLASTKIADIARTAMRKVPPGSPFRPASLADEVSSASILAVDQDGNAVSLNLSLASPFGAQIASHGFVLNNALAGFTARPDSNAPKLANQVDGSKRPLLELAPVMALDATGNLRLVGAAQGQHAAAWLMQLFVRLTDFHLAPRVAMTTPFWRLQGNGVVLDDMLGARQLAEALRSKGESVALRPVRARVMLLTLGETTTLANTTIPGLAAKP